MAYRWQEWDAATNEAMLRRALAGQARYGSPEAGYASDLEEDEKKRWASFAVYHCMHNASAIITAASLWLYCPTDWLYGKALDNVSVASLTQTGSWVHWYHIDAAVCLGHS